jgi:PAS domain S-box-containing protein
MIPKLFRDVFNASPIGIAVENLDGQPLFVNPAFCSMLGFSEEELRRKHCVDFSPPEDAQKDWELFQQLRAGSIGHYQLDKRYFRRDGSLVWGRLSVSLLNGRPSPLILAMIEGITPRKEAEEAAKESEERLRLAAQAGRMFAYSWDTATDLIERSEESVEILGVRKDEATTGAAISAMVHPNDKEKVEAAVAKLTVENPNLRISYRIVRPNGTITWLERNSRAYFDQNGKVTRVVGMIVDITERKHAEEALSKVNCRLIEAQEQERARIARELHDNVGQQLAMLAIELGQLRDNPAEAKSRVKELLNRVVEISDDVQALSHELHSSRLEYLGVVPGIRSWCREFSERQKMEIDFTDNVSHPVPSEIGLCLFRILQEALHNAIKHSGVKRIEVELAERSNEVHLNIRDSGRGFDIEAAKRGRGLGLTSMQERARLVGGTTTFESKPMQGTRIHVRVPLESNQRA